ncbi:MAG: hypothetical protein JXR95_09410 [Deltaproteobacteria bacterium]|nr:hypothetical protein [Deltaproteobacteria bacterium]
MISEIKHYIEGKTDLIKFQKTDFIPVHHYSVEFSMIVRNYLLSGNYDAVAVEFPETLQGTVQKAAGYLPGHTVVSYPVDNGNIHLLVENTDPMWEGIRSAFEQKIDVYCIDRDVDDYPSIKDGFSDTLPLGLLGEHKYTSMLLKDDESISGFLQSMRKKNESIESLLVQDELRHQTMAWHLLNIGKTKSRILCICGLSHVSGIISEMKQNPVRPIGRIKRKYITVKQIPSEMENVISENPAFFRKQYEKWRINGGKIQNRYEYLGTLLSEASEKYRNDYKISVKTTTLKNLMKYARNLALLDGNLFPWPWDIVTASNSMVDHDFGYIVHEILGDQEPVKGLELSDIVPEDIGKSGKTVHFHRRIKQRQTRMLSLVRNRPKERYPGEWGTLNDENSICSYQPEDIVVESFGAQIAKRGTVVIGDMGHRVHPFSSSMMDKLDIRETLRNWHEGRLYVEENYYGKGKVGAVVIIYDHDNGEKEKYPYRMHWLGEHDQESDMAFYSTRPGEIMVGPEISRCEYGGMLMSWPPMRMWPIWEDPWISMFKTKSSMLLAAALQITREKIVVYAAPDPPQGILKRLASSMGLKIVYLPLGTLSPDTLRKTQHFHILGGHEVRKYASTYIFDD